MKLRKSFLKSRRKIHILTLMLVACMLLTQYGGINAKADEKVIRVGYDSNSKFIQEINEEYYGYGVEYLNKIAAYTGWKYEFVKDDSWHASWEKLRNGEIDLLCTAHYTEERAKEFEYADIPLGYETTLLYTMPDSAISYQEFDAMDGVRIGLLQESYSAEEFVKYAREIGFEYEGVFYERENDMKDALKNGEIQMMVIGSRYASAELKLVDRFGANAFYCISTKNNQSLIEQIEEILQEIMFDDPKFEGLLNEKYFGHNSISNSPLYTEEELAFVENAGTIKVKILLEQIPTCYVENGETKGIWAEILKLLSEKSGIQFELESAKEDAYSVETIDKFLNNGYLLLRTKRAMEHVDIKTETIFSNPITSTSLTYVKRQDTVVEGEVSDHIIGMTRDIAYLGPVLLKENPGYKVRYYENTRACLEGLLDEEVDLVIQNSHRVSYLMQRILWRFLV